MDLPKMSGGQATARATLYPALFVDKPGDYRHGDTIAYVNRAEYLPLFEAAPDLLAACRTALTELDGWQGDPDDIHPSNVAQRLLQAAIAKATGTTLPEE